MCGILFAYDQKARPELRYGLSLNAIISILATGCKASLMFMIGEAVSQLKWVWFRAEPKQLLHLQHFDSASRGSLGSIMILFQHRGRTLVSFGAAIIVLLLAFDPFVQQILSYHTRSAAIHDDTGVAVTKRLKHFVPDASEVEWDLAWVSGIWSNDNMFHPTCSSVNCTWPRYRSIEVCSQCADITTSVSLDCHKDDRDDSFWNKYDHETESYNYNASCHLAHPQGTSTDFHVKFGMAYKSPSAGRVGIPENITWYVYSAFDQNADIRVYQHIENLTFAEVANPLAVFALAKVGYNSTYFDSDPIKGIKLDKVTECSLAYCLNEHDDSVTNGVRMANISTIDYGQLFWRHGRTFAGNQTLCWRPTSSPWNITFEGDPARSTSFQLSPVEFAFCGIRPGVLLNVGPFVGSSAFIYHMWDVDNKPASFKDPDPNTERIGVVGLEVIMSNVADSLNSMALHTSGERVNGTAYAIEVFVEVQWAWLILPALLVISGTLFFVLVILINKKDNTSLWKSSVLAYIYHGLNDVGPADYTTASKMEEKAEDMDVQLQFSDKKGDLILGRRQSNTATD
ncbi:uncharacterized protein N7500_000246 [Penicillium coprophilum]|uniref:uncharacterized protein n=1 Tax=Penicillium coprophilum TaxID=36646 RepID=UPI0023A4B964|nr:uncharacterized protein N7500_000246 [Penicillium coprophilum]KAJ5177547.1 hypothetical protein N7500_000246 [Penicillium coprophilum]